MARTYAQAVRLAEQENRRNRRIETVPKGYTISSLFREFHPTQNLLLDGSDDFRKTALYRWIERLYRSEDAYQYPIVVISLQRETIGDYFQQQLVDRDIPLCRSFVRINEQLSRNAGYEFGLGLPRTDVHSLLSCFAARKKLDLSLWTIFDSIWDMLEEYGYETNLDNLEKVYRLGREQLAYLLDCAGKKAAAQSCRNSAEEYEKVNQILKDMIETFAPLAGNGQKSSLAAHVRQQMKWRQLPGLPMIYFELPDRILPDFLEYIQAELKYISSMVKPLVIIDSVNLQQDPNEATEFYKYISMRPGIALTLTAGNCVSLFPQRNASEAIAALDGAYKFLMILMKSTNDPIPLTGHRVGKYRHVVINNNAGVHRQAFHFFNDGVDNGWTRTEEMLERLRVDDLQELEDDDCYVLTETEWYKFVHIAFR